MKVHRIKIRNFKGLDHYEFSLDGKNIYVMGPNAVGKSSFIDAVYGKMPKQPLKENKASGEVAITTDDYIFEFKFNDKGKQYLNVFDKEGTRYASPKTLFKEIFGAKEFSIDNFLSWSETKKVDFIKDLAGIDWEEVDQRYKELYDERTYLNRNVKEIDAKLIGVDLSETPVYIDIEPLKEKIKEAEVKNEPIIHVKNQMKAKESELQIVNEQLEQLLEKKRSLNEDLVKGNSWLEQHELVDIEPIQLQVIQAQENNYKYDSQENLRQLKDESVNTWMKISKIEKEMEEIKELKKSELENANLPIKGLTIDESKLYLDGLPFNSDQINTARRIIAGLEIEAALNVNGEMQIASFDGSLLDNNSIKEVEKWAEENDLQLFIEFVERDGNDLVLKIQE